MIDLGMASGALGFIGQERTNAANAKQAAMQIDFQREQSETVHQRAVKDLRAAGLNPILSATRGGNPAMGGAQAVMQNSVASAQEARRAYLEQRNLQETNRNIEEDSDLKRSARNLNSVLYNVALNDADLRRQQLRTEEEETQIRRNTRFGTDVEGQIDRSPYGTATRYLQRIIPGVNSATSAARNLREPPPFPPFRGRFRVR